MSEKPKILVLGGCGFLGRSLVQFLVEEGLVSLVRAVDKAMPITAFFSKEHTAIFKNPLVHYMQADLTRPASMKKAFTLEDGGKFDYVVNLAAETKLDYEDNVYEEKIVKIASLAGAEAVATGAKKFIEVSTSYIYAPSKRGLKEDAKIEPWTQIARFKKKSEDLLLAVAGLPVVVLRPAIIYGPGDISGLAPRVVCARIYKKLDEKMKFLWKGSLKLNTVHVRDMVRAIWHAATMLPEGSVFNVSDEGDTDQGTVNTILESLFGIRTGFFGMAINNAAKLNMRFTTDRVNDKHMGPWAELLKESNITNTPVSPYLYKELLYNKNLCVDGTAITETGFSYSYPKITEELLAEQLQSYYDQGIFPPL